MIREHESKLGVIRKYLVFILNENRYAIPLSEVKEVIGLPSVVPIPQSPSFLVGLINLRGKIISAIDLRLKLGMPKSEKTIKRPAVILVEVQSVIIGFIVDSIQEVLSIDEANIERSFEVNTADNSGFIDGIARFKEKPMILLLALKKAADISEIIKYKPAEVR